MWPRAICTLCKMFTSLVKLLSKVHPPSQSQLVNTAMDDGKRLPREVIADLRTDVLARSRAVPDLYDPIDVARMSTEDWTLERFVLTYGRQSLVALDRTLRWRKSVAMNQLSEAMFPAEYFDTGLMRVYGSDRVRGQVLVIRANTHLRHFRWQSVLARFAAFVVDRADRVNVINGGRGLTVLIDCHLMTERNLDTWAVGSVLLEMFRHHYPGLVTVVLLHRMPSFLRALAAAELSSKWTLRESETRRIVFIHQTYKLVQFIALEQLPAFLNGRNPESYCGRVPDQAAHIEHLATINLIPLRYAYELQDHYRRVVTQICRHTTIVAEPKCHIPHQEHILDSTL